MSTVEERLAVLEALNVEQTRILQKLEEMPVTCAERGILIQQIMEADLPSRVQGLEGSMTFAKRWGGIAFAAIVTLLSREWIAAVWVALQRAFA